MKKRIPATEALTQEYDDMKHPNDHEEYLMTGRSSAKRKVSAEKGIKEEPKYGADKGSSNPEYRERGAGKSDDERLNSQALPNTRDYSYF